MGSRTEVRRPKVVVVGGSIAGLCAAHAIIAADCEVTVVEKSATPPAASPTGAGLSLEPQAQEILSRWLSRPDAFTNISLPFSVELHQAIDADTKERKAVARDDAFNYRCVHWSDLHSIIYEELPPGIILWGHRFLSFHASREEQSVTIRALALATGQTVELTADMLVAADGSLSSIRQHFLLEHRLRYSGYSAWRGVFDFSGNENSEAIVGMRKAYPELGRCLYFDMVEKAHCVFFELRSKKINWIWYFNRPEPDLQERSSVTMKVSEEMIEEMHKEAAKVWGPELANLMKETQDPFINVIYDSDPLPRLFWGNVVLVGDAAHPTTPHGSRSTNMSILDAEVLGSCLKKWKSTSLLVDDTTNNNNFLQVALQEYESIRLPVVSSQVLHSRIMGQLKQGLLDRESVVNTDGGSEELLKHKNMPFYCHAPLYPPSS